MGTIADKLEYLRTAKNEIRSAIESKKQTVTDSNNLLEYAEKIRNIYNDAVFVKQFKQSTGKYKIHNVIYANGVYYAETLNSNGGNLNQQSINTGNGYALVDGVGVTPKYYGGGYYVSWLNLYGASSDLPKISVDATTWNTINIKNLTSNGVRRTYGVAYVDGIWSVAYGTVENDYFCLKLVRGQDINNLDNSTAKTIYKLPQGTISAHFMYNEAYSRYYLGYYYDNSSSDAVCVVKTSTDGVSFTTMLTNKNEELSPGYSLIRGSGDIISAQQYASSTSTKNYVTVGDKLCYFGTAYNGLNSIGYVCDNTGNVYNVERASTSQGESIYYIYKLSNDGTSTTSYPRIKITTMDGFEFANGVFILTSKSQTLFSYDLKIWYDTINGYAVDEQGNNITTDVLKKILR